jgi:DNA invertase Pin-like site-specific DNA recombinase
LINFAKAQNTDLNPDLPFRSFRMSATVIGYIRVSTEGQAREGVSLDAQRERIAAYATAKGLQLTDILVDEGLSGKTMNRPALRALLERCRAGTVGHVVVWKLDRLTRRTRHLLRLVEDVFLAHQVELHSVSESLDTSTPHGRFVLTLFGGLAQMERELIGDRTRGALAYKRTHQQPTSHPPYGFRANGKRNRMVPVPEELETVKAILRRWRAGGSYAGVAAELNAEHVPTKRGRRWHASTVRGIVQRRDWYATALNES